MFQFSFHTLPDLRTLSPVDLSWLVDVCNDRMLTSAYLIAGYADTVPGFIDAAAAVIEGYDGSDCGTYVASCKEYRRYFQSMALARTLARLYEVKRKIPMDNAVNKRVHSAIEAEAATLEREIEHKELASAVFKKMGVDAKFLSCASNA